MNNLSWTGTSLKRNSSAWFKGTESRLSGQDPALKSKVFQHCIMPGVLKRLFPNSKQRAEPLSMAADCLTK